MSSRTWVCRTWSRRLLKVGRTLQIDRVVKTRGLTQARAGLILGIKQPHVSALMRLPRRQFFGRAVDGVFDCARPGRADRG